MADLNRLVFLRRILGCGVVALCFICLYIVYMNMNCQTNILSMRPQRKLLKGLDKSCMADIRAVGSVLPAKEVMATFSNRQLFLLAHSHLDNIEFRCHRKIRMGKIGDGGWEVCDDPEFRPSQPCIVYSFGIAHDFTFDDDVANAFGCKVYSFDPSMNVKSYQRSPLVYFSKIGIGNTENVETHKRWEIHTLSYLKNHFKHQGKIIDVLKMDVESAEWNALPKMIQSGELTKVRQLAVEFHQRYDSGALPCLNLFKDLGDLGFRIFYTHKNPACPFSNNMLPMTRTACYEVHFVNTKMASTL